jgi:hypothetical protein
MAWSLVIQYLGSQTSNPAETALAPHQELGSHFCANSVSILWYWFMACPSECRDDGARRSRDTNDLTQRNRQIVSGSDLGCRL